MQFPPVTNDWGTKYFISDTVPPLLAKGGTTNLKELNLGTTHIGPFIPLYPPQADEISPPIHPI
jgi:hypothetical protein